MRKDTNELFVYNSHFCMITYNSVLHLDILSRGGSSDMLQNLEGRWINLL